MATARPNTFTQNKARRSLQLQNQKKNHSLSSQTSPFTNYNQKSSSISTPLERYALRRRNAVRDMETEMEKTRSKIMRFDDKLKQDSAQNSGHLSACSNCHLKLGHTKKVCKFSAYQSAYSCGLLSKHSNKKTERTALQKEITRIQSKLTTAKKELETAERAAEKVTNSVPKKIEDLIMAELPNRYTSNGLRNWVLLNKDVAVLQKHIKGSLPSRESVTKLLYEVIIYDDEEEKNFEWDYFKQTDHKMTSHKRLLTEDYAIKFPPASKKI